MPRAPARSAGIEAGPLAALIGRLCHPNPPLTFDRALPLGNHTVRSDRGHEWKALFYRYVEDKGIRHVYIKPTSLQLNGKVEILYLSHRDDKIAVLLF